MNIAVTIRHDGEVDRLTFRDAEFSWVPDANVLLVRGVATNGYQAGQKQDVRFPREHVTSVEVVG